MKNSFNVARVEQFIRDAPDDPRAEKIVRYMLAGVARNAPLDVVAKLAERMCEIRRSELQNDAASN